MHCYSKPVFTASKNAISLGRQQRACTVHFSARLQFIAPAKWALPSLAATPRVRTPRQPMAWEDAAHAARTTSEVVKCSQSEVNGVETYRLHGKQRIVLGKQSKGTVPGNA